MVAFSCVYGACGGLTLWFWVCLLGVGCADLFLVDLRLLLVILVLVGGVCLVWMV